MVVYTSCNYQLLWVNYYDFLHIAYLLNNFIQHSCLIIRSFFSLSHALFKIKTKTSSFVVFLKRFIQNMDTEYTKLRKYAIIK
jgi:hypothetical protein